MVHLVEEETNVHHYEQIIRPRVGGGFDPVEEVTVSNWKSYVEGEGNRKIVYDYDYELDKNERKDR